MKRKTKVLISALCLTALYGVYYFGVPAFLNRPQTNSFVEKTITQQSGYKVNIDKPNYKMGLLPEVRMRAENFSIINDDGTKALNVDKPDVKINLLPLILQRAQIKHFSAKKVDLHLVFDKDGIFKLGQYPLVMPAKSKLTVQKAAVNLHDYNVYLTDEIQNKKIRLDGKEFRLDEFHENKKIKFATQAKLYVGGKASDINLDIAMRLPLSSVSEDQLQIKGSIDNLNLADFSNYASSFSHQKIKSLNGIINLKADTFNNTNGHKQIVTKLNLQNLAVLFEDRAASIYHNGDLNIKSDILTIKNGIYIKDMSLKADGIDTFLYGTVTNTDKKNPDLNLKVTINKSKLESFIPLLPGEKNLIPEVNLYKLKKYGYYGDIVGSLDIKGKADEPLVTGNILSENGYLIKPLPNNTPKATIKLTFNGTSLSMDVKVPASVDNETVFVNGSNELYGKKFADLYITSTKNIPLKTAQIVLNPLHEILNFDLGPVPIMDIRGIGNINLHVTGNRANPHGWGSFNFKNTSASFNDIHNMTLENGTGTLTFDDQNTHFITKSATLNGQPAKVDGTCTLLGVLDFDVTANGQDLENLLKIVKTSPMLADIQKLLEPVQNAKGNSNFKLKLTGQVKDVNDVVFNKNIFANGTIELINDTLSVQGIPTPLTNISGVVNFNNLDADFNIKSKIEKSVFHVVGKLKDNICEAKIVSDKFVIGEGFKYLPANINIPFKNDFNKISASFIGSYNGPIDNINFDGITAKGKIYSNRGAKSNIIVDNGSFEINNSNFKLAPLKGTFSGNPYFVKADISDIFGSKRKINGNFAIKNLNLANVKNIKFEDFLPAETAKQLGDIKEMSGTIDLKAVIKNNNTYAFANLKDTSVIYGPKNLNLKILSGTTQVKNDVLFLNKINGSLGEMPLFIDGKISDIYKNPDMNIYVSTKPTQLFFDEFFNKKSVYPIKVKGDIILTSNLNGTQKSFNAKTNLKLDEGSSLYYMGASVGDAANPVQIYIDNNYTPDRVRINSFKYDKIIASQNNKNFVNNMLNASGIINLLPNNNLSFRNFRIKTEHPTDAKIFNIIFRKPFMKQGLFTSDLIINGNAISPNIIGKLEVTSIDMPLFDATVKDVGLEFRPDKILITSRGVVLTNDLNFSAVMKNNLTQPFVFDEVKLNIGDLNVNKITDMMRDTEAEALQNPTTTVSSQPIDLTRIIIRKGEINADKIQIKNINAQDFAAELSLNDKMLLDISNFKFKIADGSVNGKFGYNFLNHKINLAAHMQDANAQIMSEALFDLKNQIYGSVTGDVALMCNGKSHESCFNTLSGESYFIVEQGKMPKLGSLEYLLKAGNLIQTGLTGLSINSLIDLITPLKTGEFESIHGDIHISNGIADNVNIYSDGRDLNMYLTGSYNLTNAIADMKIYGSLSKDITTVFGKIKNASLNTLLNTIPGITPAEAPPNLTAGISKIPDRHASKTSDRIFIVDILGDINGENYVKSFRWVK